MRNLLFVAAAGAASAAAAQAPAVQAVPRTALERLVTAADYPAPARRAVE
ncbi:MAG TPA: hypothetical protein VHM92_04305 [Allosphingosinicella sp.]|nr:hypothetical protein [Allosphingosinicella sp.]